ncbi:MAG TPA: hypothetical protein PK559_14095, partial [Ignavibacteriaceae bacterium]|nr:hypothetical protein [Ignavibacteriaceae bacterium]
KVNEKYIPIACGTYDLIEQLIIKKTSFSLEYYNDEHEEIISEAVAVDVFSNDGAEFLKLESGLILRLDKIISIDNTPISSCKINS